MPFLLVIESFDENVIEGTNIQYRCSDVGFVGLCGSLQNTRRVDHLQTRWRSLLVAFRRDPSLSPVASTSIGATTRRSSTTGDAEGHLQKLLSSFESIEPQHKGSRVQECK